VTVAALVTLSSYDSKETVNMNMRSTIPIAVFSFGSPRVGNPTFTRCMEEIGVKVLRLVNKHDMVPKVPGFFINERNRWSLKTHA
jgi:predicted lipase